MPLANVSFVLDNAMFNTSFTVLRTPLLPNRLPNVAAQETLTLNGVIEIGSMENLVMDADLTHSKKAITVHTRSLLYDVVTGYSPDIIIYNGTQYKVMKVWDYSQYGDGYYAADCDILDLVTAIP